MAAIIETKGKSAPRIDMTPMVDLGFLLITFFVMTTTLSKQRALQLDMPNSTDPPSTVLKNSRVLNVVVGNNKIATYFGLDSNNVKVHQTNDGFRKTLIEHEGIVNAKIKNGQLAEGDIAFLIVKPTPKSTVADLVNILDELTINDVSAYSIIDANAGDEKMVN
jgi:biopolymer transport protein ExbD